jgi:hypothetical protein
MAPVTVDYRNHVVVDDDIELIARQRRLDPMPGAALDREPVLPLEIEYGVDTAVVQPDHEVIVARLAVEQVVARGAVEGIVAGPAMQNVVAGLPEQLVVARVAVQMVIAGAAMQLVVAAAAMQTVVATAAVELVVTGIAHDHVGARIPDHVMVRRALERDVLDVACDLLGVLGKTAGKALAKVLAE